MSEEEIARYNETLADLSRSVDLAWKKFWQDRGINAALACKDINTGGPWYSRGYGEQDATGVFAHMLEPAELITRAVTRKKTLKQFH